MNKKRIVMFIGIVAVAINMRLPITAIPPLLSDFEKTYGLSSNLIGLLTSIPLLTFAVSSPILVRIARKLGNEITIAIFLILLGVGSFLRIQDKIGMLLIGTFLIGLGISSANVLLPAVIKQRLKNPLIGITAYSTSMLFVGAIGTGTTGLLSVHYSLRNILMGLSIISVISIIGWLPLMQSPSYTQTDNSKRHATSSVWKSKVGWLITIFFGLQALLYYSLLTWLPSIFLAHDFSTLQSGTLVTILQIGSLPMAFIVPFFANRKRGVQHLCHILGLGLIVGLATLLVSSSYQIDMVASFVVGIAAGVAFNLAIVFFTLKAKDSDETANISAMAQSAGYLLAAVGPVWFGWLHTIMHSWSFAMSTAILLSAVLWGTGYLIDRSKSIA
ncbi:MFS transporter [Enterococcus sp. DIV0876]|uniref:MFS transporter n=1 Tax=Enterococcus sp. DIV0876 TaxID=2774633 RepID=UPI003D2FCAFA